MNGEKELVELNTKIGDIIKKQTELKDSISRYRIEKENLISGFLTENLENQERISTIQNRILTYFSTATSMKSIRESIAQLYHQAFRGIVAGRVLTNVVLPDNLTGYRNFPQVWINCRGFGLKYKEGYWSRSESKKTRCIDSFDLISYLLVNYPGMVDYIKRSDKKEIFNIFHTALKSWRTIDKIRIVSWDCSVKSLEVKENSYEFGISNTELKNYVRVRIYFAEGEMGLKLNKKGQENDDWNSKIIRLNSELDCADLYILSQLPEEVFKGIEDFLDEIKIIYDENLKVFDKLREDISPYILEKLI